MQELEDIEQYLLRGEYPPGYSKTDKPTFVVNAGTISSWMDYCTTE